MIYLYQSFVFIEETEYTKLNWVSTVKVDLVNLVFCPPLDVSLTY